MILESNVKVKYTKNQLYGLLRELILQCLMEGVHMWRNNCLWSVDYNKVFRSPI